MSVRFRLGAFVLGLALVVPAARADAPLQDAESRIASEVARLASDEWQGRRAGTPGGEAASAWIAALFQRMGLRPAGENGGYFQPFTFIDGVFLGPGNRLVTPGPDGARWKSGEDFRPLAFSGPGAVSGKVVFVGYGIVAKELNHDDYAGLDVKDKVVLVLRYGPGGDDQESKWAGFTALRLKVSQARDHGARAVLVVTGPLSKEGSDELVPLRSDASLGDAGLPAFTIRQAIAETLLVAAGRSLAEVQKSTDDGPKPASFALRGVSVELRADLSPRRSATRNVVGLVPGRTSDAEVVVVGAHYDHLGLGLSGSLEVSPEGRIHPGADDNASGVAAILEVARTLAPRAGTLSRGVLFVAFGAEEQGALGSSHFVKTPPPSAARMAAMLNLDMVGRLREDTLDVHGVGTSPVWKPALDEANKATGLRLRTHEGGYGPSDHAPFYAAGKPVLFFFTGTHPEYHRPADTADRINATGIARIASLVAPVVDRVASQVDAVAFVRVAAEKEPLQGASRNFKVWVGGIPDFSGEGVGVRFSGVSPGSPAEKAGIQGGDTLVRLGNKPVRNIYDYTYALGEMKPGDVVAVVVNRAGQEVTLSLTLGTRPVQGGR